MLCWSFRQNVNQLISLSTLKLLSPVTESRATDCTIDHFVQSISKSQLSNRLLSFCVTEPCSQGFLGIIFSVSNECVDDMTKYRGTVYTVFFSYCYLLYRLPSRNLFFYCIPIALSSLNDIHVLFPCPGLSLEAQLLVQSVIKVWIPLNSWLSIILFTSCILCQLNTVRWKKQCSLLLPIFRHLMMLGQEKMSQRERDMGLVVWYKYCKYLSIFLYSR